MNRPVVWSIAGADSGGGAGLSADQRAADAFGVHLCPVVAAITAQNSREVSRVQPADTALLDAQFDALSTDMPPRAIKTGLLGSASNVRALALRIDALREHAPVALVIDPVLGSTTGATFANDDVLDAYRTLLVPRATAITPNRREAARLLGTRPDTLSTAAIPAIAQALRAAGAGAVCVTGGDHSAAEGVSLDWLDGPHARGWLTLPRVDTPDHHGTGCTFATSMAAALALGFVLEDACILAKMATAFALKSAYRAGSGSGPVHALPGFGTEPDLLPVMSWGTQPEQVFDLRTDASRQHSGDTRAATGTTVLSGRYAIADDADQIEALLAAGVRTLQLNIKRPDTAPADVEAHLREQATRAVLACRRAGAALYLNSHRQIAHDAGADGVHLDQNDLLALTDAQRAALMASGLKLGISAHSLWELCRARTLSPAYVTCDPVWPTPAKALRGQPQGLDNLAWWQHLAGIPVVAVAQRIDASAR